MKTETTSVLGALVAILQEIEARGGLDPAFGLRLLDNGTGVLVTVRYQREGFGPRKLSTCVDLATLAACGDAGFDPSFDVLRRMAREIDQDLAGSG